MKYILYRHYDASGNLLYVGSTMEPLRRLNIHKTGSSWFDEIRRIELCPYNSKKDVALAEGLAIQKESPAYNINHRSSERAIEALRLRNSGMTLQQIADEMRVSRQRIHQLIQRAKLNIG